ncbi:G-protein coupled receptor 183 [Spea bombifrons]|uniref:G-protein coupled receptor 183 n=1 Tax=Spea bombifrons TaxID=233779 RepID=UPI00234A1CFD|nr:G-protein coupled receptor 183 [Spea bombifrons]
MDSSFFTILPNNYSNQTCDLYVHRSKARILMPLFYSCVFLIGLIGNVIALLVIYQNRRKLNSTTLYSTHLVISDIFFVFSLPTRIAYYALGFHWLFGEVFCRITSLIFYINTYASVNFMTCLSVDRFFAVVHPYRYNKIRRANCAKLICILVWLIVFFQTLPLLLQPMSKKEPDEKITCMEYPNFETIPNLPLLLLGACFIGYLIPLVTILVCYSQISKNLYQSAKKNPLMEKSGTNKKAINTIILVIVVFFFCFTPYHIAIIQHMFKKLTYTPDCKEQQYFQLSLHITVCLMNMNCGLDPFIYFFACKGYKRKVLRILRQQVSISSSSATRPAAEESSRDIVPCQSIVQPNTVHLTDHTNTL